MIINFIKLVIVWFFSNFSYVLIVRCLKYYNNQIMSVKFNPWLETCNLITIQFGYLKQIVKWLIDNEQQEQLQQRKFNALQKVINNLNETLTNDLGIKTTQPATTGGIDVWVYLANKLDSATETKLENYFSGVLSKYTQEFALDILVIEQIAGAGWVAKFDVKPVAEAQYNRMARASEVVHEEKFDEEIDIW
ncbi:TPA: hypothetical protein ACGO8I_001218 [Streptococcus suis]|nr:hypothetical protein [Streptococcus suis]HEM5176068.1 hypothetical protein [Streptococcus suis]HEM5192425.1 hypothetical protein [Streptococcus suis]